MIPHLEQQIAFLTACRDHGENQVEWRNRRVHELSGKVGFWSLWSKASDAPPEFLKTCDYEFRVRHRKHFIPRAEIPAEDPEGIWTIRVSVSKIGNVFEEAAPFKRYCTKQDRDAVVGAMLAREEE